MNKKDKTINVNKVAVQGLQDAIDLFSSADEVLKDSPELVKLLLKLQANKTLFHAIDVTFKLSKNKTFEKK